jgi:hypothetical protein
MLMMVMMVGMMAPMMQQSAGEGEDEPGVETS